MDIKKYVNLEILIAIDTITLLSIFIYFIIYKREYSKLLEKYINLPKYYITDILLFILLISWFTSKKSNKYLYGSSKLVNIFTGVIFIIITRII